MKLHILGCGDAFGSGGRNQSGYLVDAGDRLFLLDCGPGSLPAMKRLGIDPERLDAIFLSHLHGDHFGGLPFFFLEYLYENPRREPLHIAGPPGTEERVNNLFQVMYGYPPVPKEIPPCRFHLLEPERSATIKGIAVYPFRVPHQEHAISLGLKVDYGGKRLLYSGDSPWCDLFVAHARGVDLFLCECSFFDPSASNHMNYIEIQQNLPRLECKKLLLIHLGKEMLSRKDEITLPTAEDGMVIEI